MTDEERLTVKQVATRLQKDERTIRLWLQQGKLKGIPLGRGWQVPVSEVDRVMTEAAQAAQHG